MVTERFFTLDAEPIEYAFSGTIQAAFLDFWYPYKEFLAPF